MASRIKVDLGGPVFNGSDRPIVQAAFRDSKQLLAKWGQEQVMELARSKPKHGKGRYAAATGIFDLKKGLTIMPGHPEVLRGPWLEGTSIRNESTGFRGYRIYKLVRGRMRKNIGPLIDARFRQAVHELNGGGESS